MREAVTDLCCLAGSASLSYAGWIHYPPAGFAIAGACLWIFGVLVARGGASGAR